MNILIIAEPGRAVLVCNNHATGVVEGPQVVDGNPYGRFGDLVRKHFNVDPLNTNIVVAQMTSGSLERFARP